VKSHAAQEPHFHAAPVAHPSRNHSLLLLSVTVRLVMAATAAGLVWVAVLWALH
jgi:hypothetical protein